MFKNLLNPVAHLTRTIGLFYFLLAEMGSSHAEVKLPAIFGDHMVLQQGATLPIWGWADPGEKITVQLGGENATAVAGADGTWRVDLSPVSTADTSTPQTLKVAGKNSVTLQDVLVGDVWVASGQSNMELGINMDDRGKTTIAAANEPQIRLFLAPRGTALEPQKDLNAANAWGLQGKWQICSPDTLGGRWGWNGFSAAAYYFAHELQPAIGRPVGVIETAWGGTPAQSWVSLSGLQKEPVLDHYVQDYQKFLANYDPAKVAAFPKIQAAYDTAIARWNQQVAPAFNQAMDEWKAASARAVASGQPAPPQPKPSEPKPTRPVSPDGGPYAPSALFNGMVAPLIPFAIKGVIWYQGESNSGKAKEYATLFPRLITDWREKWNQGDFPFLFVQLPNYIPKPNEGPFVQLREAQSQTLSLPNTGMAVTIDIGNPFDIHPRDKLDVGHRLALVARHVAYGENLVYSGPTYQGMSVEGNKIRLTLQNLGTGLTMGIPPWTPNGAPPLPATTLNGFTIAGSDQKWVEGTAVIEGDSIVVSSSQVPSPLAVRYDWANNPSGNLYNKEALPAAPFRTDTWDLIPLKN